MWLSLLPSWVTSWSAAVRADPSIPAPHITGGRRDAIILSMGQELKGRFLWSAFCNTWISFHTPRRKINWLYSHFAPDQNNIINQQCLVRAVDLNCGAWFRCFSADFDTVCKENTCLKMCLHSQPVCCPWEEGTSSITLIPLTVLWF